MVQAADSLDSMLRELLLSEVHAHYAYATPVTSPSMAGDLVGFEWFQAVPELDVILA